MLILMYPSNVMCVCFLVEKGMVELLKASLLFAAEAHILFTAWTVPSKYQIFFQCVCVV